MENKTQFIDIRKNYLALLGDYRLKENFLCAKILVKERQLQKLEAMRMDLSKSFPYWTELLLSPVIEHLKLALPNWICEDDKFIPMGIGAKVTVFFIKKDVKGQDDKYAEGNSIYISFIPGNLIMGELCYQTGESNNDHKTVESIEEIIQFLKAQIKSNGTC